MAPPVMDGPGHLVHPPVPDIAASTIPAPTPAPGMGSIRTQPDVTTSVGGPQHQAQPQRGAVQPLQAAPVRAVVNHVVPELEPEPVEETVDVRSDEKEVEEEEEVVAEFVEPEKQQPQQPQQQAEPGKILNPSSMKLGFYGPNATLRRTDGRDIILHGL